MRVDFRKTKFVLSALTPSDRPKDGLPEILIVGRSNVGKSSLINALCGAKLAFPSKKAGKTKLLNFFLVDSRFYLVDSPGYGSTGFATMSTINFASMMESYHGVLSLKGIVYLVDLRRELGKDDLSFLSYLKGFGVGLLPVLTKADTYNQSQAHLARKRALEAGLGDILFSDLTPESLTRIRAGIAKFIS